MVDEAGAESLDRFSQQIIGGKKPAKKPKHPKKGWQKQGTAQVPRLTVVKRKHPTGTQKQPQGLPPAQYAGVSEATKQAAWPIGKKKKKG